MMIVRKESGVALIFTLLILLVMSILTFSSMDRVTLQEKMVSAQREGDLSLELTEGALREAEARIDEGLVVVSDFGENGPLYAPGEAPDVSASSTWDENNTFPADATQGEWQNEYGMNIPAPRYFIELIGDMGGTSSVTDVVVSGRQDMTAGQVKPLGFRIVARSQGFSGQSSRIVEVYYAAEI